MHVKAPDASSQNAENREHGSQPPLSVLDAIPDATIAFDPDWCPTYMNQAARVLLAELGVTSNSLGGASIWDMVPDLRATQHQAAALRCRAEAG